MIQKKTLVFGASINPHSYSNLAIQKLVSHHIETLGFGIRTGEIAGITIDTELKSYDNIHTISLYLSPKNQASYYDYILSLKPKRILFNPGTENDELINLATSKGIECEIACTLVLIDTHQF